MIYYIFLFLIIIVLRYLIDCAPFVNKRAIYEDKFSKFVLLLIVLMAAFRGVRVGADTILYIADYQNLPLYDFSGLNVRYEGYIGYYYLSKIFSLLNVPLWGWFGFIEFIYVASMYKFIRRFSKDKLFSILVFCTIGLMTFSFAGLKQVLSMSIMMFAFMSFIDKRYVITILLCVYAYFTHPAGLIFLAAFPLYLLRNNKRFMLYIIVSVILVVLFSETFMVGMVSALDNEHFEGYLQKDSSYSFVTLMYYIALMVASLFLYKLFYKREPDVAKISLGFVIIACGLQSMARISPNMFRLAFLYIPFMMILLPNTFYYAHEQVGKGLKILVQLFIILFFLYVNRNTPYYFM